MRGLPRAAVARWAAVLWRRPELAVVWCRISQDYSDKVANASHRFFEDLPAGSDGQHSRPDEFDVSQDGQAGLRVTTTEIPDPGPLVDQMPSAAASGWLHYGEGMIGYGEAVCYVPGSIAEADDWWRGVVAAAVIEHQPDRLPPGSGLIAFGSFVFDPENTAASSVLTIPEVVIGRRDGRAWRTTIRRAGVRPAPGVDHHPAGHGHPEAVDLVAPSPGPIRYADGQLSGPDWERVVASAVRTIECGDVHKVVLAREMVAAADRPIDPRRLINRLAADYPRCWTFHVNGMIGATPEMLIRRENGLATSRVLAGTIRRAPAASQDLALGAALSQSSKDLAEHQFAVTSVAEALTGYSSGMNVPDMPSVLELPNVLHLATDVTAVADECASSLTLAAALHPSAAVCGTPTAAARDLITTLERLDRGRYAGPVGWIDADGDGEWGIALRCGQIDTCDPAQIRLYAGCGVVADSDPEAELAESNAKLVVMRDALEA